MAVLLLCLFVLLGGVNNPGFPQPAAPSGVNQAGGR